jgi:hypothetical protein
VNGPAFVTFHFVSLSSAVLSSLFYLFNFPAFRCPSVRPSYSWLFFTFRGKSAILLGVYLIALSVCTHETTGEALNGLKEMRSIDISEF